MAAVRTVRALALAWLCCAGLAGCGGGTLAPIESVETPAAAPESSGDRTVPTPGTAPASHVVRGGETLYAIAFSYGFDYRRVAAWNGVSAPYVIYPGQRLRLHPPARKDGATPVRDPVPARPSPAPSGQGADRAGASDRSPAASTDTGADAEDAIDDRPIDRWHWPTKGPVITGYTKAGGKGIDIGGKRGQPVVSASAGRVVYAGGGLIGYGELIIVKHNKRFLTAYAHNDELLVKEGENVKGGQRIASMGNTGTDLVKLHFEIRRDGKPVNPLRYLPK